MNNKTEKQFRNKLAAESSPYLLQHASNPVDWYPWGGEAFTKARNEDKPLLISIGYAACHWCHVMEHESFEDTEVADFMNQHFVCIKVDREERPDVDQVYMNAVQLITGRGGWPLNCFALPDGRPFYGGTYFPKDNWLKLLEYLSTAYHHEKENIMAQADQIVTFIKDDQSAVSLSDETGFDKAFIENYTKDLFEKIDFQQGGTRGAPKFPMPSIWQFLLRYYYHSGNSKALELVNLTLVKMAEGGIYDQIGGGFARYSVDARWHIPHFEKMLYDNAQLVSTYSEAWQVTKNPLFRQVVYETIEFVERELTSPEGGFYSSLDADSEGEEGRYYAWQKREIDAIHGHDSSLFCSYFDVTDEGNWEDSRNHLHVVKTIEELACEFHISTEEAQKRIQDLKAKLFEYRSNRIRPGLDNKILTSWNALMIKGLADAYRAFGEPFFLQKAIRSMEFILQNMTTSESGLFRNYMNGKATVHAFLDDYAFLIDALINLYRCTFNEQWLFKAQELTEYVLRNFNHPGSSLFYYTDQRYHDLVVRKPESADNVIPSSNSAMAGSLNQLGIYFGRNDYLQKSYQLLAAVKDSILQYSSYHANWAIGALSQAFPPKEVAIAGREAQKLRMQLESYFLPGIVLAGATEPSDLPLLKNRYIDNKNLIYVCENNTCQLPVESVDAALELITEN